MGHDGSCKVSVDVSCEGVLCGVTLVLGGGSSIRMAWVSLGVCCTATPDDFSL